MASTSWPSFQVCVDLKYPPSKIYTTYTTYRKIKMHMCKSDQNQTKSGIKMQKLKVWVGSYVTTASDKSMHKLHVSCLSESITFVTLYQSLSCVSSISSSPLPWVSPAFKTFCISFQAAFISCHLVSSRCPCHSPQKCTEAEHGWTLENPASRSLRGLGTLQV